MSEELIDSYIDRNGIKGDTEVLLGELNRVYRAFKEIEGIKIDMRGFEGLGKISPALSQAKAGADALAEATKTVEARIAALNGHSKEFTDVLLKLAKAQEGAAKASAAQYKADAEAAKAKGELAKAAALEAKASAAQYKADAEAAKAKGELAKATLLKAKADTEAARAQSIRNKESDKTIKQLAAEKKAIDDVYNDYLQLSKAYNEAALKAKNYALRLGENHPITVQAVKDANDMSVVLKRLDASVGQHQRNVGNYKSAFDGLGMSFAQVARELPSLSISVQQFALAVSNNLPMVADELQKAKVEIAALKAEGKDAPSLFSKIGSALFSWQVGLSVGITLLTVYAEQITNFISGLFSSSSAIDQTERSLKAYNSALSEASTTAKKNSIADVTKLELYRSILTDVTRGQKERNQAMDAYNSIADKANQLEASQLGNLTLINDKISTQIGLIEKRALSRAAESLLAKKAEELFKAQEKARVKALKEISNEEAITNKQMEGYVNKSAINTEAAIQMQRKLREERIVAKDEAVVNAQAEFDAYKKALYGKIQLEGFFAEEVDKKDPKKKKDEDADKRIQILAELRAIEIQRDIDFYKAQANNEDLSLVERLQALQKYYQSRRALIDLNADTEKQIGKKTTEELLLVEAKRADDLIKLDTETYAERDRLINEFSKKFTEDQKKAYEATDKVIQDAYKRFEKSEKDRTDKEKEESKKRIKQAEEEAAAKKRLQQELVTELLNLAQTLGTASIEREKNAVQEQIDQLEAKKQKDIEVANQTIANAQDRTAAIQVIEARAAAQKEQLERRQRELDVKKAQFDKARSIANIIQETATNIVKYFGTPLALLAGAIGAVQLATVIAQPIPRYKHGKNANDLYEGPAIVDDGGKPEAIIREDGSVEIGGNTPRLTYVKKRDVVLPDANQLIDYVLAGHMGGRLQVTPQQKADSSTKRLEDKLDNVVAAIKSQPKTDIRANEGGLTAVIKYGASQLKYINDQTNW